MARSRVSVLAAQLGQMPRRFPDQLRLGFCLRGGAEPAVSASFDPDTASLGPNRRTFLLLLLEAAFVRGYAIWIL